MEHCDCHHGVHFMSHVEETSHGDSDPMVTMTTGNEQSIGRERGETWKVQSTLCICIFAKLS